MDPNYDEIVPRIQQVYNSCSKAEQQMLKQILSELANTGYSYTYEQLFLSDFTEVPVSIDQFICGENYLGPTNNFGDSVYDFWKQMFRNVFNSGNRYNEILLSGATRIGKTSSAVTIMAYMLYRLMLYRNPHDYFHKKAISRFTLAFANLTKDLAEGVAFHEFNSTLKASPWFQRHGTFTKSVQNPIYLPEGDKIDIVPASDAAHVLGMQVWCLAGDTLISTPSGDVPIQELAGDYHDIYQYDYATNGVNVCNALILKTNEVTSLMRIELEDGSVIEGTPNHQVMLSDGSYKMLCELTEDDDLMTSQEMNWHAEIELLIPNHMQVGQWRVFNLVGASTKYNEPRPVAICSSGKYIVCLSHTFKDGTYKKAKIASQWAMLREDDGHHFYMQCSFGTVHRLVAMAFLPDWDESLQVNHKDGIRDHNYISNLEMATTQQNTAHYWMSDCFKDTRIRMSEFRHHHKCSDETRKKMHDALVGIPRTSEVRAKISASKKGHSVSEECRAKIRNSLLTTHGTQINCYFADNPEVEFHSLSEACAHINRWNGYIGECLKKGKPIRDQDGQVKEIVLIK